MSRELHTGKEYCQTSIYLLISICSSQCSQCQVSCWSHRCLVLTASYSLYDFSAGRLQHHAWSAIRSSAPAVNNKVFTANWSLYRFFVIKWRQFLCGSFHLKISKYHLRWVIYALLPTRRKRYRVGKWLLMVHKKGTSSDVKWPSCCRVTQWQEHHFSVTGGSGVHNHFVVLFLF